ncbi:MAG: hypothetical protein WED10_15010 [Brumimicrobium sp.]
MKKHSGMRPHDIAILLKIISKGSQNWLMKEISSELEISASEVSESINRSTIAKLIENDKKTVDKASLLDFLKSGLRFVFPQQPKNIVNGILTAHSAAPLNKQIFNEESLVWPYEEGTDEGKAIQPLHPKIPQACLKDNKFYELMALTEALRIGNDREQKIAIEMIKVRLLYS